MERTFEKIEDNHIEGILAKVVDLFDVEDLKFRAQFHPKNMKAILDAGLHGEVLRKAIPDDILFGDEDKNLLKYREQIRSSRKERDGELNGKDVQIEKQKFSGLQGNVFYPEGVYKIIRSLIESRIELPEVGLPVDLRRIDQSIANLYGQVNSETNYNNSSTIRGLNSLFNKLHKNLPSKLENLIKENTDIFCWDYYSLVNLSAQNEDFRKFIIEHISEIRKIIIEDILSENHILKDDPLRKNVFIDKNYRMSLGVIFNDSVDVRSLPHGDFITQGVLMDLKARPRDIIGIFVSVNNLKVTLKNKNKSVQGEEVLNIKLNEIIYGERLDDESEGDLTVWEYLTKLAEEKSLPVYDLEGNLLWPKRISHEDIVKMEEEKRIKKEE